jgi:hypothetical protein
MRCAVNLIAYRRAGAPGAPMDVALQPVEDPAALRPALDQTGIAKLLEMARYQRLAQRQALGQLADRPFALRAQPQEAKPSRVTGGTQAGEKLFHRPDPSRGARPDAAALR